MPNSIRNVCHLTNLIAFQRIIGLNFTYLLGNLAYVTYMVNLWPHSINQTAFGNEIVYFATNVERRIVLKGLGRS